MKNNNIYKILVLLFIPFMFLSLTACSLFPEETVDSTPELREPPQPRLSFETVERGTIRQEISGLSRVAPKKEQELYFEKNGRVREIFVSQGDDVEKGQPLARLETGDLEFEYKQASLDLERFELEKERMEFLLGSTVSEYDLRLKEIDYKKLKLRVERLKEELDNSTIYAPFDGRVISLSMREADMVEGFARVMSIADISELELQMNVHSRDLNKILAGQRASVQVERGLWIDAEVKHVPSPFSEIAPGQQDLRVRIDFINLEELLEELEEEFNMGIEHIYRFNNLLSTRIIIQEIEDALLLPPAAIREYGRRTFVLIQDEDFRKEIDIKTGLETSTRVEILEGLEEGQEVISR
ncbi:efflux RND transporter periplasmic adaptor subunit [Natronospora cellulosivora (SeqCode)]